MEPRLTPLTVLLVEDDAAFRDLVRTRLWSGPFEVRTAGLDRWVDDVRGTRPDVVLLDLTLSGDTDAVAHIPQVIAASPTSMVAVLTGHSAEEMEAVTRTAGAFVFYEKSMVDRLGSYLLDDLALFHRALAGEVVVAPAAHQRRPVMASETTERPAAHALRGHGSS